MANLAVGNSLTDDATRGLSVHRESLSYQAQMTQFHSIKWFGKMTWLRLRRSLSSYLSNKSVKGQLKNEWSLFSLQHMIEFHLTGWYHWLKIFGCLRRQLDCQNFKIEFSQIHLEKSPISVVFSQVPVLQDQCATFEGKEGVARGGV